MMTYASTILVGSVVFLLFLLAVRHIIKTKKKGGCVGCPNCENCGGCHGDCHDKTAERHQTGDKV